MLPAAVRRATANASASATACAMAALAAKPAAVLRAAPSAAVRAPASTHASAAASLPAASSVAATAGHGNARSATSTVSTFLTGDQLFKRRALPLSATKSFVGADAVSGKKRLSLAATSARAAATVGLTTPSAPVLPQIDLKVGTFDDPLKFSGDLLIIAVLDSALKADDKGQFVEFADEAVTKLDQSLGGILSELASEPDFKGKTGQKTSVVRLLGQGFKRVALLGLGKSEAVTSPETSAWQGVGASIAALAKASHSKSAAVAFVAGEPPSIEADAAAAIAGSIATGAVVGSFSDVRFKSEESDKDKAKAVVESVEIVGFGAPSEASEKALFKAVRLAAGTILTRQLVNAPPNVLTPEAMAQVAVELSQAHADVLSAKVLDEAECERLGMGAYLGVAAASENPPKFIHLTYSPPSSGGKELTKIALIGKGLTFDSGGYNLKAGPGSMIHLMKFDMGGAAAVLGAAKAVAAIQPEGVEVHFIIAACENMVSGKGMRPGDILTASNGKTIEVNNTDAEGRLTLADALVYACKLKVTKIIDVATLTGACIIALGDDIGGLFTPSDEMAKEVSDAAKAAGEKVWRMPMEESYWEQMKSNVADFVNTGGRAGGSITASLFLKRFVEDGVSWAHLDIAGPVWSDKKGGGTGYGAALLYKWVETNSQ